MLAVAWEEIQAYETQSYKPIQVEEWPKTMKLSSPGFIKAPIGLDHSPREFQQRRGKNQWSDSHDDNGDYAPRWVALDQNNSASGWQLPQRQKHNVPWRQDTDQSGYYSEDSELDSASITLVLVSKASTTREGQNREQEGTFNHHLNQKIILSKLNDYSSTNNLWIWLADAYYYVDSGCSMSALENEISNGFLGVWFCQNHMLGDSILIALNKMKQTDQHQHSKGLLQKFYTMTQKHNEPIGQYAVRLDMAAGKVRLQSQEALGSTPEEWGRLLVNCLLQSMDPKLWARVAHLVDGKAVNQRPAYYDLIKFAVKKEAEINFDEAKKTRDLTSKPKARMHFHFNSKKSTFPTTPAVQMVAPALEEGEATPLLSEESDSSES